MGDKMKKKAEDESVSARLRALEESIKEQPLKALGIATSPIIRARYGKR
jgi:hypothetical protein